MSEPPPEIKYRIIGGNQREYGPVTGDQIRQWIAEGRASASTLVLPEGSDAWQPLSAFPEFAEALAANSADIGQSQQQTPILGDEPLRLFEDYSARAASLDIGSCYSRSWRLLKENPFLLIGSAAVFLTLTFGLIFLSIIGAFIGVILSVALWAAMTWLTLKVVRRQRVEFPEVLIDLSPNLLQLLLMALVASLGCFVGSLLCILPGIYLTVSWLTFSPLLVVDKRMDFWPALELGRRIATKNWWNIFALFLVNFILAVAGSLLLVVGLLFAVPFATGAVVYAYEDIFGSQAQSSAS